MRKNSARPIPCFVLAALTLALVGCGVPDLPETLDVALSATEKLNAPRNSGPASLADTSWSARGKADPAASSGAKGIPQTGPYGGLLTGGLLPRPAPDEQMFLADFGSEGQVAGIRENTYLLPRIYGVEVPVTEEWTKTSIPLLSFRSASYGLESDDRYGFAILVQVKAGPIFVGRAFLYSWGQAAEERIDGTFGYLFDFTEGIGGLVLDSNGGQFPFYALREE